MVINTKGIGAVVATGLLLVVAVVAVIGFQTWFSTFSSGLYTQTETQSGSDGIGTRVERVVEGDLYFRNGGNQNISIDKVEVNGINCNISQNISSGMEKLNLENCTSNVSDSVAEVVVYTDDKIYSQKVFLDISSNSRSSSDNNNAFISIWNVSIDEGVSGFNSLKLPLQSGGNYNFTVDWGDGNTDIITTYDQTEATHTYSSGGEYRVEITGTIDGFAFYTGNANDNQEDGDKLIDIKQWGSVKLSDGGYQFSGAENFNISATDVPGISNVSNFENMFLGASSFNADIDNWDMSSATNMESMFRDADSFNQDLNNWDVSNVINMQGMFWHADTFNGYISNWDTSSVTDMYFMFRRANSFNSNISDWNVSNVNNMGHTFAYANNFNKDIGNWEVNSVTTMDSMFRNARSFDKDLSNWDTSNVTTMNDMFYYADTFNQNISSWNTSNVTDMSGMFRNAASFSQDLSSWCVSQIASKPDYFDTSSGFELQSSLHPNWGQTC